MIEISGIRAIALGKAAGGGNSVTVEALSVTANGTTTAPDGKAYSPVTVNVPNTYAAGDEGKVVSGGALVAQTSRTVTTNGTVDTTTNNSVTVDVAAGDSYLASAGYIGGGPRNASSIWQYEDLNWQTSAEVE